MITPVTFIIAIDGSAKLREHVADISQLVESSLNSMMINDDLGFILFTDVTKTVAPLQILRPHNQKSLKQDILQEVAASQDATSRGGHPSKTIFQAIDLLSKRSNQDQWRPAYIILITDGRPEDLDMPQLWNIVSKSNDSNTTWSKGPCIDGGPCGPVFLDVYSFNKHHAKKDFVKAIQAFIPGATVLRVRGRIDIVKSLWHFRDRVSQARNSVHVSEIPGSLARRRAPGHVRIPSIFTK